MKVPDNFYFIVIHYWLRFLINRKRFFIKKRQSVVTTLALLQIAEQC